jgi:hypothetical protein
VKRVKVTVVATHSTSARLWHEYYVHVVNASKHALKSAVRAAWRKYPTASSIEAQFVEAA